MVKVINSNQLDIDFTENILDYKTTKVGTEKKVDFVVENDELIRTAVTCGCTSVEDVTRNSFSINYGKNRTGTINQVVTLTFKSGEILKITLKGYVTS